MSDDSFGLKIGIDGEKEFKNSLREINSEFKVLASEMNLVTSEFSKNDSSVEALTSRNTSLNREIETQKQKIALLKSALDNASASFGENDKRTQNWATQLNNAQAELNGMEKELKDVNSATSEASTPLSKLTSELSEQGEELKSLQTQYKNVILEQGAHGNEAKNLASQIKSLNSDIKDNKDKLNDAEDATSKLGDAMNDTSPKVNVFGDVLKANLTSEAIKAGIQKIVDGFKKLKDAVVNYVSVGTQLAETEKENYSKLAQVMQNTMNARDDEVESIFKLTAAQEKVGVVSKTTQLGGAQELATYLTKKETLEKLIPVMNDMTAQQYGVNASQENAANIATMLGKVMDGQVGALSRYGYKFDEAQEKILKYGTEEERCAVLTDVVSSSVGGMNEALGKTDAGKMAQLTAALEDTQTRIGEVANEIKVSFAPALSEIGNKAADVGDSFGNLVESMLSDDGNLSEETEKFKESVKSLIDEIGKQMPAFLELGGKIIGAIAEGLWAAIKPFIGEIAGWGLVIAGAIIALGPPLSAAVSLVMAMISSAIATWPVALAAVLAGLIIAFWPEISKFFADLWNGLSSSLGDLWGKIQTFLSDNWQGLLLLLVNPFAGAFKLIYDNCDGFRGFVDNFVTDVKNFFINGWNAVVSFFTDTVPSFITSVGEWFNQLPYQIGLMIGLAIGYIVKFGTDLWNFATTTVPQFINQVVLFFMGLPEQIWTWLLATINKVQSWGIDMGTKAQTYAANFINNVVNTIKELPGKIWTWLSETIQKVVSWGSDMVSKGRSAATDLFNTVVDKIKEIPGQMLSIGKNIVEGIWNGISNATNWIVNKVKDFAKGITDGIKSALGISSPSTIMEEQVGKNMALGIGEGFTSAMNAVQKQMQKALPTEFDTNLNMALDAASASVVATPNSSDLTSNLIDKFNLKIQTTNENVSEKLDSILLFLQDYIPELQNRQLCLDTGALVGNLTPPINKELAKIQSGKERGR